MHTYNRIVRCKRCATLHTHCDKTWPTCRRCTDAGVPCNYRATKLTGFPCDRCTALHKKCSKDEEGGCSRCRRAGQQCVYVPAILKHQQLTEAEAEAVEQAESVTPPSSINWNNAPTAEDPITPTTSLAKVCNDYYYSGSDEIPDCFRPTQKQSAVLKKAPETLVSPATRLPTMTTAIIGRMPKQQQSPTFKEWMLVHAYIHSHDERVQQHLAHYILDKAAFTVEFVFQPSALWSIVCALALLSKTSQQHAHAATAAKAYYIRAQTEFNENLPIKQTLETLQTCFLVASFAFRTGDCELGDAYFWTGVELCQQCGVHVDLKGGKGWRELWLKMHGCV